MGSDRLEALDETDPGPSVPPDHRVALRDEVVQTKLYRIDTERRRELVEQGLQGEQALRPGGGPIVAGPESVRPDARRAHVDHRPAVRARDQASGEPFPRGVGKRSRVVDHVGLEACEPAVAFGADAQPGRHRLSRVGRRHILAAGEHQTDGPAEAQRSARHQWLDQHLLGAERAADRRRRDADTAEREVEQRRERVAGVEQALGARCDHERAVVIDPRRGGVRLEVALVDPWGGEAAVDDHVCGGERRCGVAVGDVVPLEYLVGVCVGGSHRVEDRLERLGIDEDGLGAVGCRGLRACDDERDRLAREHGDVSCQRHVAPPAAARDDAKVVRREDRHDAGHGEGGGRVDGPDPRVRVHRRDDPRVEEPGRSRLVCGEAGGACHLGERVGARSRDPDYAEGCAVPATVCHLRIVRDASVIARIGPWPDQRRRRLVPRCWLTFPLR